ncbi:Hypothetical predicted protein [Lecanosticta acicola]|uniref:Heterokaryon incompatibility domain-containing protein n=1 Tax=Lecanosticta acicola TaxID=111012 RepID=A0AAI8Z1D4_9PEZI|nr:Hypothetical predicted protein [Lecanosticta acicola]
MAQEVDSRAADAAWQNSIFEHNSSFYGDDLTTYTEQRKVRLLEIQPAAFGEPVSGVLTTEILEPDLEYDALSYAWGVQSSVYEISINDKPGFQVGYNVHCALKRIREKERPVKFWIDCICINQYDIRERGHQVSFMREIFSSAWQVCCWLGVCTSTTFGVDELEECDDHAITDHSSFDKHSLSSGGDEYQRSFVLHVDKESYHWWDRIWTLQELCVARNVVFLVGPHRYNERAFTDILRDLDFNVSLNDLFGFTRKPEWTHIVAMLQFRMSARQDYFWHRDPGLQEGKNTLLHLLLRTVPCQATDPRDKLYALFPLCHHEPAIPPDYGVSWSDLCTQATFWLLKESGLDQLIIRQWPLYKKNAPSWTLDFSVPQSSPVYLLHEDERYWVWDWQQIRPTGLPRESELGLDGSRLRIMASCLGHVEILAPSRGDHPEGNSPPHGSSAARDSLARSIYADWRGHVTHHSTLEELFARVCRRSKEKGSKAGVPGSSKPRQELLDKLEVWLRYLLQKKILFRTTSGHIGASQSDGIRKGDEVHLVDGLRFPVILRPTGEKDCYRLIGGACVLGVMHGEMRDCIYEERHKMRQIALV